MTVEQRCFHFNPTRKRAIEQAVIAAQAQGFDTVVSHTLGDSSLTVTGESPERLDGLVHDLGGYQVGGS